jgi:hypothetical protein
VSSSFETVVESDRLDLRTVEDAVDHGADRCGHRRRERLNQRLQSGEVGGDCLGKGRVKRAADLLAKGEIHVMHLAKDLVCAL